MRVDIITIFPEFFDSVFSHGIINKALQNKLVDINVHDLREYSEIKHKKVDDTPYGGGVGMVMNPQPIGKAINSIKKNKANLVILTTPQGQKLTDNIAKQLSEYDQIILICGRYEGVDERVNELFVDIEISTGEYINSGGEYAAALITDAVSRYLPGVLGKEQSLESESFKNSLLEYPQYTKPNEYNSLKVPDVLLSGNHSLISKWRKKESIKRTFHKNPELLDDSSLSMEENEFLLEYQNQNKPNFNVYIALIHYPVYNKQLKIISTACKSIDIHDISRDATTYGVKKFFVVTPVIEQQNLVNRLINHWTVGEGIKFNDTKSEAFEIVDIKNSIEDIIKNIRDNENLDPKIVVTDARIKDNMIGYSKLKKLIFENKNPFLILFGTGWGISNEIIDSADYKLKPLKGYTNYNHLSVRSASAIILDRLLSCKI